MRDWEFKGEDGPFLIAGWRIQWWWREADRSWLARGITDYEGSTYALEQMIAQIMIDHAAFAVAPMLANMWNARVSAKAKGVADAA